MLVSGISVGHFFELAVRCVVASVVIKDPNIVLTTAGAAGITGTYLQGSDLFYVAFYPDNVPECSHLTCYLVADQAVYHYHEWYLETGPQALSR